MSLAENKRDRIIKEVKAFYRAGRVSHIALMGYGLSCVFIGLLHYWLTRTELSLGILLGLSIFGAIQVLVGSVRFIRSFKRYRMAMDSAESTFNHLKSDEYHWVIDLIKRVDQMRIIESIIFVGAFSLLLLFFFTRSELYFGTLLGVTLHAAVLLAFDLFMQFRLIEYQRQIEKL